MSARPAGVPGYLGRVLDADGRPLGTCFQVASGVLVTAWHVLDDAGAGDVDAEVAVDDWTGDATSARVLRIDPLHDLAVLRRDVPLPGTIAGTAATDPVLPGTPVLVTGVVQVDDAHDYSHLHAVGVWRGDTMRDGTVPLGRFTTPDVLPGMSGAPVRRRADDTVIGVVSARYNSPDGWLEHTVWVARVEDLAPLLVGIAAIEVDHPPLGGPADVLLTVTEHSVRLTGAKLDVEAPHCGVRPGLANALADVRRARGRAGAARTGAALAGVETSVSLRHAGELLAQSFLPGPVGDALAELLHRAEREHVPVRLGVVAPGHGWLPWEALSVAGRPLALHPLVTVYRQAASGPRRVLPGPLRIVVAISAPDGGGGAELDYERELRNVLAAVRSARQDEAQVRVVPFASTTAIRDALEAGDAHVLHLSAHGEPGALILEDDDGQARSVDAETLLREAVPAGRMPPVISLAACYTSVPAEPDAPSFAATLATHGACAVIGTETSVTDRYATRLFARVYAELARSDAPDAVRAVAEARRAVQRQLVATTDEREKRLAELDEWSVVTVLAGRPEVPVLDPAAAPTPVTIAPAASLDGLLTRPVGEFVGRRREQRRLPRELAADSSWPGVVLHGIGGIGKTTLAAELTRRLVEREPARQVVVLPGPLSVDAVLGGAAARLRQHLIVTGTLTGLAWQAVQVAGRPDVPWGDRWALLRQHALELVPLLVVLDNFEDNLAPPNGDDGGWTIRDESLAELLAAWAASPGRSRLLVTSRYAFTLPGGGARRLRFHPVGPMSLAETYKLIWSLPVLDRQDDAALGRVWRAVGGHPRSLEYLDALLAGGVGRFPDITERLTAAVRAKLGEAEADRWLATGRDLDAAVAEVVTLAADDVLLGEHLARLAATPDALRLLVGASVYREPVDLDALLFQIGEPEETRWRTAGAVVDRLLTPRGVDAEQLENLAVTTGQSEQVRQEVAEFVRRYRAAKRQPGTTTVDLRPLVGLLAATTLLSVDEQRSTFFVHRWTAAELERQWTAAGRSGGLRDAHRRAADYWIWRVNARSEDPHADVHDLLEARHHLLTVGDVQEAAELITRLVFMQFWTWGAWDRARSLALETIGSLPAGSSSLAEWSRHLGILSHARGDYAEADQLFRRSLQISEGIEDQRSVAADLHHLGMVAHARENLTEAEHHYRRALDIHEKVGDRAGIAAGLHQIGMIAQERGRIAEAERLYHRAIEIKREGRDEAGIAATLAQLSTLASAQGDTAEAERLDREALRIRERHGDQHGIAQSLYRLGTLAYDRRDLTRAERHYQQALTKYQDLGIQQSVADCHHRLGMVAHYRGDLTESERCYRRYLAMTEEPEDSLNLALVRSNLALVLADTDQLVEAIQLHCLAFLARTAKNPLRPPSNLQRLVELRERLPGPRFRAVLTDLIGPGVAGLVINMMDGYEAVRQSDGDD